MKLNGPSFENIVKSGGEKAIPEQVSGSKVEELTNRALGAFNSALLKPGHENDLALATATLEIMNNRDYEEINKSE